MASVQGKECLFSPSVQGKECLFSPTLVFVGCTYNSFACSTQFHVDQVRAIASESFEQHSSKSLQGGRAVSHEMRFVRSSLICFAGVQSGLILALYDDIKPKVRLEDDVRPERPNLAALADLEEERQLRLLGERQRR